MLWAIWGLESCLLLNSHGLKPGGHAEQSPVYTYWVNGQLSDVYPPLATNVLLTMQKTTKKKVYDVFSSHQMKLYPSFGDWLLTIFLKSGELLGEESF